MEALELQPIPAADTDILHKIYAQFARRGNGSGCVAGIEQGGGDHTRNIVAICQELQPVSRAVCETGLCPSGRKWCAASP